MSEPRYTVFWLDRGDGWDQQRFDTLDDAERCFEALTLCPAPFPYVRLEDREGGVLQRYIEGEKP